MASTWMQCIESTSVVERLHKVGIEDTVKWKDRIKKHGSKTVMLSEFPTLLIGDLWDIQEAISEADGEAFEFTRDAPPKPEGFTFQEVPVDAKAVPDATNVQRTSPTSNSNEQPGQRQSRVFTAGDLGPVNKSLRLNSDDGTFKPGRRFSCFVGAIAEAGVTAKAAWYSKVCRAAVQYIAPLLAEPYYPNANDIRDILQFFDVTIPDLMRVVSVNDRYGSLQRAFGRVTKRAGSDDGMFDDEGHNHGVFLSAWEDRGVNFKCVRFVDWMWRLPKQSGMRGIVHIYNKIMDASLVPRVLMKNMKACDDILNSSDLQWVKHVIDLPVAMAAPAAAVSQGPEGIDMIFT